MKKLNAVLTAAVLSFTMLTPTAYADSWVKTNNGYVYQYDDGTTASKGWLTVGKSTYYIKKDGTRQTGWLKTTTSKYYFGTDGKMYKSKWLKFKSGDKYYLRSNGKAATGVVAIGDVEYKFGIDGECKGTNYSFILNADSKCLHSDDCRAAKTIEKENYKKINIGSEEFEAYAKAGYWLCGVNGCNDKELKELFPDKE